jgi:hypothetical protein
MSYSQLDPRLVKLVTTLQLPENWDETFDQEPGFRRMIREEIWWANDNLNEISSALTKIKTIADEELSASNASLPHTFGMGAVWFHQPITDYTMAVRTLEERIKMIRKYAAIARQVGDLPAKIVHDPSTTGEIQP